MTQTSPSTRADDTARAGAVEDGVAAHAVAQSRPFGRRGLRTTALGLGGAGIAGLFRDVGEADAQAAIDAAWEAGIRSFDVAPFYGYTQAEHRMGRNLRARERDAFVLSTKVGRLMRARKEAAGARAPLNAGDAWASPLAFEPHFDYTYDGILRAFEDSQQRLGLARIDVILIHDIGRDTHGERADHYWRQLLDGGFRALDELRRERGVRAVGLGVNETAVVLDAMREFDIDCALLAGRYTLLEQASLDALLPECVKRDVSILLGGAFNSGILAQGTKGDLKFNYDAASDAIVARVRALEAVCDAYAVPLASAALQFPYAHPAIRCVMTGARSAREVHQNVEGFTRTIPDAFWHALKDEGLLRRDAPTPADGDARAAS
ncbi:aldo/keto reductase [Pararobbsia silviterrae]|uniref:Aldo/keto reductase n=1 Tax=Pararobbsia silviterrae TaxID=1792498 RepID=A0A494XBZ8_9BURK|nr:aldo/keto reductase [Pararobbsia silviterrae]RKP45043.1 aldo/keto reductase [Pararobbsia silviterrae]